MLGAHTQVVKNDVEKSNERERERGEPLEIICLFISPKFKNDGN
jgi:hypothetical protein